jgi:tetratricopeptide (TPR) repeat protein
MNEWFEAEQRVERAHEMYRCGRWEEALRELQAALRVNPAQGEWHFNMGLTLEALGRYPEAAGAYRRALEHHGAEPELLKHLGAASLRAARPLEALQAFDRAAKLDPGEETSYVYRIDAYRQLGQHDEAEVMFYSACQINDQNPRTYILMAQSLLDREQADRALACLDRAREIDPRDPDLHAHLGEAYRLKGDLDRALEEYTVQVGLHPHDTLALLDLSRLLIDLDRAAEADARLRRVIELDPGCAEAHFERGCIAVDGDHPDAAQLSFQMVLQLDPSRPGAHQRLAAIALGRRNLDEARRHLAAELALLSAQIPLSRPSLEELSRLLADAGMHEQAIELLTDLARSDPQDAELWHQLAVACFLAGRLAAGTRYGRRAVRADGRHLPALQNLIVSHLRQNQLVRARYWLGRAEAVDPEDPRTRQLRGQVFVGMVRDWLRKLVGR